jgi:CBS domain containing-hemolysin-like protein
MSNDTSGDPADPSPPPANGGPLPMDEQKPYVQSWIAGLRQRLGMPLAPTLRDTIEGALRHEATGQSAFTAEERQMMLRMLRFGALRVADIMVPRADIIALDETEPLAELLRTFEDGGISRIPIFAETLDDPRGMIHIKDLLPWLIATGGHAAAAASAAPAGHTVATDAPGTPPLAADARPIDLGAVDLSLPIHILKIKRPVLYVPPSMPAMNLLIRMQATRIHMALVVDEYGGTDGLVTIEDLVEQVVGDIEDEYDDADTDQHIARDAAGKLVASARVPVVELEEKLGRPIVSPEEAEEVDTLGGLVVHILGRVPLRGEIVRHTRSGLEFEVLEADPRRIKRLRIDARPVEQATDDDGTGTGPKT